jgi:hypothetical protein
MKKEWKKRMRGREKNEELVRVGDVLGAVGDMDD